VRFKSYQRLAFSFSYYNKIADRCLLKAYCLFFSLWISQKKKYVKISNQ